MSTEGARLGVASLDEATLVQRVSNGDRAAFEVLMRRYNRLLYRLARASLHDDSEAKDAVQDAYINAFRSIGQFRGESRLSTWLSRLVLNECLARQRRSKRRENVIPIVSSDPKTLASIADDSDLPDKVAAQAQMRAVLECKVSELPEIFRVVFVLRSVEELSVEETAQCLGLTEETVRSRHFRAKSLLRESLAKELDLAERDLFEFGGMHCDDMIAAVLGRLQS